MRAILLLSIAGVGCSDAVVHAIVAREGRPKFEHVQPWDRSIESAAIDPRSKIMIDALVAKGGWGTSGKLRIDFGFEVLETTPDTPYRSFTKTSDFFDGCDHVPFPLPPGGALSGESGYRCASDGDCYLLVHDRPGARLYEMWRASFDGTTFRGGCAVVWDLRKAYGPYLRGKGCSSADGAGLPIAPLLATADEVESDRVHHALRLALPADRVRRGIYVSPASHSTSVTAGGPDLPPYGARFRLKASFDESKLPTRAARVLAVAMKRYGLYLASGGNVPLAVRGDRSTKNKWAALGLDERALENVPASEFEILELGTPIDFLADTSCHREP